MREHKDPALLVDAPLLKNSPDLSSMSFLFISVGFSSLFDQSAFFLSSNSVLRPFPHKVTPILIVEAPAVGTSSAVE